MRRQTGFTLIELLLVLAIIGIISAVAVPALLGQRERTRNKATVANVVGHLGDLVGQYDKGREEGLAPAAINLRLDAYLAGNVASLKTAWGDNVLFNTVVRPVTGATTQAEFEAAMLPNASTIVGKIRVYVQHPTGTAPGYLGLVTNLTQPVDGSLVFRKCAALD